MPADIIIKRVYDPAEPADGYRVLVDRLWPRGLAKADAALDAWAKDLAPSPELRQWFGHQPQKFGVFAQRYREELDDQPEAAHDLLARTGRRRLSLLYAARDPQHNHAVVLRDWLMGRASDS